MNLASALFKRILELGDFDTWSSLRRHYLPSEFTVIYDIIEKHVDIYHKLPTLEDLKLANRDSSTEAKIFAISAIEVDSEPFLLLDYLKNEFTQKETLLQIHKFVEQSISFETAEETIESLYTIISDIESKVELDTNDSNMQKISLFESDEQIASYIKLGLNREFDENVRFRNTDYILMGGRRGSGKTITCSNLAETVVNSGGSVLFFTIEMEAREILQRQCSIATQIAHSKIKYKNLDNKEWLKVAEWWASRYVNGAEHLSNYIRERDFDKFHAALSREALAPNQIDIIYDPDLTLSKFRSETLKRVKKLGNVKLIIVDYINQMKRNGGGSVEDLYDWKEQINISKAMKSTAQELGIPVFSPFQTDNTGEARFAKGILDSADAAFSLTAGPNSIHFECTKMRGDAMQNFTSAINWSTLTIGPENGDPIVKESTKKKSSGKSIVEMASGIYDDS